MSKWNVEDLGALPGVPPAMSGSAGYVWTRDPSGSSNHIVYVADDRSVHELYMVKGQGEWGHSNLGASAGAPRAFGSIPFGYTWNRDPDGPSQNVLYVGEDRHIHQLYFRAGMSRWAHIDLYNEVTPQPALIKDDGSPFAYVWDRDPAGGSSQHIVFAGGDSRIHEFYTRGGGWSHNDLHTKAGALHLTEHNRISGYVWDGDPAGSSQHVVWRCNLNNHVHEFWFNVNDRSWHDNDVTSAIGAPAVLTGSTPTGYSWERDPGGTSQHVIYLSADRHLRELWFGAEGRRWSDGDLTQAAGAPDAFGPHRGYPLGAHHGYTWDTDPDGPSQNIGYHHAIGGPGHLGGEVHVLSFDKSRTWRDVNITSAVQQSPTYEWNDLVGWAWDDTNSAHLARGLRHYWAT
jgi:hypothetical protein